MHARDFVVIGGGVIGLRIATEVKLRFPDSDVTLLEKEERCGLHASGRNSGVLHAGFYYTADSFKARFTRDGNRRLSDYCVEHELPVNRCGKLVVARSADELDVLDELLHRARLNGVELESVSVEEARRIEPRARTHVRALYSPTTATVDPTQVVAAFAQTACRVGVEVRTGVAYRGRRDDGIETTAGALRAGYVINAAGLYADRIARDFGFASAYRILPFKGLYLHGSDEAPAFRTNIYPVPDLRTPFLGVHLTVTVDGGVTIGPTAVPAFWREGYRGLENFRLAETLEILRLEGILFLLNRAGFRDLALRELPKYLRSVLASRAARLAVGIETRHFKRWGPAGIRAQLVDLERYELVTDFKLEGDEESFHVLNAVSPAFTCAIPFAEYVLDEISERIK
ncbi:MAG: L-2-hydroxyglutarate oxidase [Gemmatimonadetes bacterium]|uniref:L-2-hydroxyglutarate oxidase n=1 Tax=Candidatus Kutchimonas denitrificans TaxID=3056748 RepID=A0AAE4Z5P9_9BACT|nr:L-2-hydroxyglutarate oxidase [Gemmatimonadota bacterium]NIR73819.1 L-2-hydroxyglutarate oxidase [Candidatus Kutchimonas denitrificans]NIS00092.1 L-2-hydroxyglutarate oxidase [Gemmatimonadota bacterium]NIT65681.1 L-2-hydroxyglutarate oxidase [Gemmatimonadota bacterium]NIU53129.1 L-2-hydroxyglutarate oxidase [Gemmatimonadota bacterium]